MGKVSRNTKGHEIMSQYSGRRVQEIFLGEVIFKPKLELSIDVSHGKREGKGTQREGKARAKALRWEGEGSRVRRQGQGQQCQALKAAENLAPSPEGSGTPCNIYKAK